jgi:hypothetical protein
MGDWKCHFGGNEFRGRFVSPLHVSAAQPQTQPFKTVVVNCFTSSSPRFILAGDLRPKEKTFHVLAIISRLPSLAGASLAKRKTPRPKSIRFDYGGVTSNWTEHKSFTNGGYEIWKFLDPVLSEA